MLAVSQFGRIGYGRDAEVVQRAVDAWSEIGGELRFDSRVYEIDKTIDFGGKRQVGGKITCGSPASVVYRLERDANEPSRQTSVRNMGSRIVWIGPPNQPMITSNGAELEWDGPALWGGYSDWTGKPVDDKRPSSAFEITKDSGMGSGQFHFRQLQVGGVGVALHANGVHNVDQFQVDRFVVFHVEKGFRCESGQNLANLFGYVMASHVSDAVFDYAMLCQTTVQQLTINNNVSAVVAADKAGNQGGNFSVLAGKVDPHSPGTLLVDCRNYHSFGQYSFANLCAWQCKLNLKGEVMVNFQNSQNFDAGMISSLPYGNRMPRVVFDNCRVPAVQPSEMIANGIGVVQFIDCVRPGNQPAFEV